MNALIERLEGELKTQRAELQDLRLYKSNAEKRRAKNIEHGRGALGLARKLIVGKNLETLFEEWRKAKTTADPLPAPQTSNAVAAIIRRFLRVGAITIVFPILSIIIQNCLLAEQTSLLGEQNVMFDTQNKHFEAQNATIQAQIEGQAEEAYVARRAALFAALYDRRACKLADLRTDQEPVLRAGLEAERVDAGRMGVKAELELELELAAKLKKMKCPHTSSLRAREEALRAFVKIERAKHPLPVARRGKVDDVPYRLSLNKLDLQGATLRGIDLEHADLEHANLEGANLINAKLRDTNLFNSQLSRARLAADLRGANLIRAKLIGAKLIGAKLIGTDFSAANLSRAEFTNSDSGPGADLTRANLTHANLSCVNFEYANFFETKLFGACGDNDTKLPDDLEIEDCPKDWGRNH